MTVADALADASRTLEEHGVEAPEPDATLIVAHVLGRSRTAVQLERARQLDAEEQERITDLVARRANREPLAYVLGEWGFRRLTLKTDARALVPRPETELLVERCLALLEPVPEPRVLDVGTGSGAIALAIADEHPGAYVLALDASRDALALAAENVAGVGLADRVILAERALEDGLPEGPFDLVASNPPYIPEDEIEQLAPEVRDWEPRAAILDSGQSELVELTALDVLKPGGALVVETHWNGARPTAERLERLGYTEIRITRDLAGIERVVEGRSP